MACLELEEEHYYFGGSVQWIKVCPTLGGGEGGLLEDGPPGLRPLSRRKSRGGDLGDLLRGGGGIRSLSRIRPGGGGDGAALRRGASPR